MRVHKNYTTEYDQCSPAFKPVTLWHTSQQKLRVTKKENRSTRLQLSSRGAIRNLILLINGINVKSRAAILEPFLFGTVAKWYNLTNAILRKFPFSVHFFGILSMPREVFNDDFFERVMSAYFIWIIFISFAAKNDNNLCCHIGCAEAGKRLF